MASASGHPWEEQFLCSICLDAFSEPVSTPCGHNYCKTCITGYWASSGLTQCPLCKKTFHNSPQLQVNTGFRDMVEHFNNMRVKGEDDILAKPGEVPCDICLGPKLKAQKTCMVCLASYCQPHLEPHQRVTSLKKHQLIDPVSNLEDKVCKKHNKMFELFCHVDQVCVCFMCLKDDHATHDAVTLECEFRERKAQLDNVTSQMKMMENTKSRSIKEIKSFYEQSKTENEKEVADVAEVLTALVVSLQRSQAEVSELIQEKQKAALKQAEEHVTRLEQEVRELRRRRSEMEQLSQTDDHLCLLQNWPSRYFPAHDALSHSTPPPTLDLSDISRQSYVKTVKNAVAQMKNTLSNEMKMLVHEIRLSDGCEVAKQPDAAGKLMTDEFIKEVWNQPQDQLMMIQQCHAVDVTLDPYTANSLLTVSEDGKQLQFVEGRRLFPVLFKRRFEYQPFVLGKDGFSSGRFYYEVQVSGSKGWVLGVVKESINKEILHFPTPEHGGWIFFKMSTGFQDEYYATTGDSGYMNLGERPQTVGVFVDYDKGEVSFYNVGARTLICSYTGCSFIETQPALKAFLYSMAGTSLSSRPKLYPIFGVFGGDSNNILVITQIKVPHTSEGSNV